MLSRAPGEAARVFLAPRQRMRIGNAGGNAPGNGRSGGHQHGQQGGAVSHADNVSGRERPPSRHGHRNESRIN